jgi:hypothetical protein
MAQTADPTKMLYTCVMYCYWYSLFLFFYRRIQSDPNRCHMFLLIVVASLIVWLIAMKIAIGLRMQDTGRSEDHRWQNSMSYYLIALFPYILLLKNKTLKAVAICLISFGTAYSLKRGSAAALILMGLGSSSVYLFVLCDRENWRKAARVVFGLWTIGFVAAGLYIYANFAAFQYRFEFSGTNRDSIYSEFQSLLSSADIAEALFGRGHLASMRAIGDFTHNDWVFLLYDYGVIAVVLMVSVYIVLLTLLWNLCRLRSPLALSLVSSIILMACVQMYSMGIYVKIFGFLTGSIGLVAGRFQAGALYQDENNSRLGLRAE